jgi:hypothetical protein
MVRVRDAARKCDEGIRAVPMDVFWNDMLHSRRMKRAEVFA